MKKILAGLLAVAAFTFSATAQDQTTDQRQFKKERHGIHQGRDGKGMEAMQKLNLTEAQKQQIKSINEEFRTKMQTLNQNDNLMVKDAKTQRKALMEERKNRISAVLTPEQRTQFEQFHKQHGEGKGDWKNKTKGEDWKQKRKMEDGKEKIKVKTT